MGFSLLIFVSCLFCIVISPVFTKNDVPVNQPQNYGPGQNSQFFTNFNATQSEEDDDIGVVAADDPEERQNAPKVYKGTRSGAYPFMAIIVRFLPIFNNVRIICGASILDENNVLTAGHCIQPIRDRLGRGERVEAWLGGSDLSKRFLIFPSNFEQKIPLDRNRLFANPNYVGKSNYFLNDIGVMGLSRPIQMTDGRVQKICIGTRDYDGQPVTVIGHGLSHCITREQSNRLLSATGKVLNAKNCVAMGHADNLEDSQVCAQLGSPPFNNQYTMQGDSGGPLFGQFDGQYVQIGLTSYGNVLPIITSCPNTRIPATFTRVGSFRQFIQMNAPGTCFV